MSPYTQNTVVLHGDGGSLDDFIFHFPCQIIEVGRIPGDSDQEVRIGLRIVTGFQQDGRVKDIELCLHSSLSEIGFVDVLEGKSSGLSSDAVCIPLYVQVQSICEVPGVDAVNGVEHGRGAEPVLPV